ncbi:DEAD/DEAH box helicase family protein [Clostridium butyricum]|uniref:DEAD/DEAH box helicase family protein n=1 Tax=Clostridium butyricum TaxID=1492 RepID=UPI00374FD1B1
MEFEIGTKYNDVITEKVIVSWGKDNIIFNGATGSGKTYFVENNLYKYCSERNKRILYLCNRKPLFKEVTDRINECSKTNIIDVMLYQVLEKKLTKNELIHKYDYIVCDEFHYVMADAMFNMYTDITYDYITSQDDACVIFMSGTAKPIFNKLKHDGIVKDEREYIIPYSYSYIEELQFYVSRNSTMDIIENILNTTNDKIIYFSNSTSFALEVFKRFKKQSVFRCSESSRNYEARQLNDVDAIKQYDENLITFDKRLLVATKVIDNGINLEDKSIKHIITDVFDLESLQQCIGRKRVKGVTDTCKLYIRNYTKSELSGFKVNILGKFNPVNLFVTDEEEFEKIHGMNRAFHSDFIYWENGVRKYNKLGYWKMLNEIALIEFMEKDSYSNVLLKELGDTIINVVDTYEEQQLINETNKELYIKKIIGKKLYSKSKEKDEFIERLAFTNKNNRLIKSFNGINEYLNMKYDGKYNLTSGTDWNRTTEDGSENLKYGKAYWTINI